MRTKRNLLHLDLPNNNQTSIEYPRELHEKKKYEQGRIKCSSFPLSFTTSNHNGSGSRCIPGLYHGLMLSVLQGHQCRFFHDDEQEDET